MDHPVKVLTLLTISSLAASIPVAGVAAPSLDAQALPASNDAASNPMPETPTALIESDSMPDAASPGPVAEKQPTRSTVDITRQGTWLRWSRQAASDDPNTLLKDPMASNRQALTVPYVKSVPDVPLTVWAQPSHEAGPSPVPDVPSSVWARTPQGTGPSPVPKSPDEVWALSSPAPEVRVTPDKTLGSVGERRISLSRERVEARDAIIDLLKEADASFVLSGELPNHRMVTFHFKDVPLEEALGSIAQATGIRYHVRGDVIILTQGGPEGDLLSLVAPSGYFPVKSAELFSPNDLAPKDPYRTFSSPESLPRMDYRVMDPTSKNPFFVPQPQSAFVLKKGMRRESISLRDWTVGELFGALALDDREKGESKSTGDESSGTSPLAVPDGIEVIEGDQESHTLWVTGT